MVGPDVSAGGAGEQPKGGDEAPCETGPPGWCDGRLMAVKVGDWSRWSSAWGGPRAGETRGGRWGRSRRRRMRSTVEGRVTQGDDAHLTATDGTQEPEHLVDPGQELRPEHAAGSRTRRSFQGAGRCRLLGVARLSQGVGVRAGRRWGLRILRIGRRLVGRGPSDGDHGGSQASVGSQDPVVAVPMDARRRYEAAVRGGPGARAAREA